MNSTNKLIRQIRAGLSGGWVEVPVESLAEEYARLAQEAGQRLESCGTMLEKGSEYQALQLAETEPVLLDLIAALSFAEAPEWTAYCLAQGLPLAPKFDPKAVQALDALYAKGITASHPLYKEYRAAVSSRDDERAIRTIRSIVRLNGGDTNARSELLRLENKLFQVKLQTLRGALARPDEAPILHALGELESLATPARLAELPEWAQASEVRRVVGRREAMDQAAVLARALPEARAGGGWRKAGDLLAQISGLQAEHGFELEPAEAGPAAEIRVWCDAQRQAAAETQRFQAALNALGGQAEQLDTRLLTRASLTLREAEEHFLVFNRAWKEVEKFQRPVPDEVVQRVRSTAGTLRTELDRLRQQRLLRIGALAAAACLVFAVGAWFAIRAYRVQDYVNQLARLKDGGQVEAAEKMVAHLRADEPALASRPSLRAHLDGTDEWARDERRRMGDAESHLAGLEKAAGASFAGGDPLTLQTEMESVTQLIEGLAEGVRGSLTARLAVVRNGFEAHLGSLREKLAAEAADEVARIEALASTSLAYDRDKEALTGALAQVEPGVKALEGRTRSPVTALNLPTALQARVAALRQRAEVFRKELDLLKQIQEEISLAGNLEAYERALSGFKDSRLAQAGEVKDARKLLATFPKPDEILAALILPGDLRGWAAVKAGLQGDAFIPDTVLPSEITRLLAIREDSYLNDIWQMTLSNPAGKGGKRGVFARGDVQKTGPREIGGGVQNTVWTGAIYDPAVKAEIVAFTPTTVQQNRNVAGTSGSEISEARLTAGSQCLARLELNRMTDAEGTKFERPLLKVFEDLVRDRDAHPVFKAYLMQQLGALLELRPYAWGLHYSGGLRADLSRLKELAGGSPLRSMDWLLERKRNELQGRFTPFFAELAARRYFTDAQRHREVARGALTAGLRFGGFIAGDGEAQLLGEAAGAGVLWAIPEQGTIARFDRRPVAKPGAFLRFSPIFFVPVERVDSLAEGRPKSSASPPTIPLLE